MEKFTEQLFLLQLLHTKVFEPFRNIRDVFLGGNFPGGGGGGQFYWEGEAGSRRHFSGHRRNCYFWKRDCALSYASNRL